jgi:hypothetical protein
MNIMPENRLKYKIIIWLPFGCRGDIGKYLPLPEEAAKGIADSALYSTCECMKEPPQVL